MDCKSGGSFRIAFLILLLIGKSVELGEGERGLDRGKEERKARNNRGKKRRDDLPILA